LIDPSTIQNSRNIRNNRKPPRSAARTVSRRRWPSFALRKRPILGLLLCPSPPTMAHMAEAATQLLHQRLADDRPARLADEPAPRRMAG